MLISYDKINRKQLERKHKKDDRNVVRRNARSNILNVLEALVTNTYLKTHRFPEPKSIFGRPLDVNVFANGKIYINGKYVGLITKDNVNTARSLIEKGYTWERNYGYDINILVNSKGNQVKYTIKWSE
jgi:hypothetical protein